MINKDAHSFCQGCGHRHPTYLKDSQGNKTHHPCIFPPLMDSELGGEMEENCYLMSEEDFDKWESELENSCILETDYYN